MEGCRQLPGRSSCEQGLPEPLPFIQRTEFEVLRTNMLDGLTIRTDCSRCNVGLLYWRGRAIEATETGDGTQRPDGANRMTALVSKHPQP